GGAKLIHYSLLPTSYSLKVSLYWQGGQQFAPEDYQLELALVDSQGQIVSGWRAYQTQARYPTRAWEPDDAIRDDGWLPRVNLPAGGYTVQMRLVGQAGPVVDWQTLTTYTLDTSQPATDDWLLWRDGQPAIGLPELRERETAQFTIHNSQPSAIHNSQLIDPNNVTYPPASSGPDWANFIIGPDWPAGDYYLAGEQDGWPVLRVAANQRNFDLPEIAYPLTVNFADKVKLLGYDLPTRRVEPGSGLPLTLYWQGLEWLGQDFVIFTRLLDNEQLARGGYDRRAQENYSTLLWAPGEVVIDGFAVPVNTSAPPGVYWLDVGWYHQVAGQAVSLPLLDPVTAAPLEATAVRLGPIKVGGAPPGVTVAEASPQIQLDVILGDQIKLLGFDLDNNESPADVSALHLTLYWQALATPTTDYTVFVHLRNPAGKIVAQQDGPPAAGAYPTGLWAVGEIVEDQIAIPLADVEPGTYELVVGMYDLASGTRLPVDDSPDGTILLQSLVDLPFGQ
ncbi:MAG: hypothetical protein AB1801_02145, partial [Chloroflexota bacterium]